MEPTNAPCPIEWITIPAPDLAKARAFYAHVFGFSSEPYSDNFVVFKAGNLGGGFDRDLTPSRDGIGFSITVQNLTKTVAQIRKYGGEILREPYQIAPGAGFCAKFADPNGNVLEVYAETVRRNTENDPDNGRNPEKNK